MAVRLPRLALAIALSAAVGATTATAQSSRTIKPDATGAPASSSFYVNSWALVIGINAYQKVTPRLNYAVADAKAVAEALPALGFPRQNIRVLLDGEATKTKIETTLYRDFARMGPGDRLLVFFAGHGETVPIRGGEEGYFLPVDADPQALPLTALPMDEVKRISQRLKARHYLFVMDACFSGFSLTRDIVPKSTTDEYLSVALREPVVQVLTAGRKGERAIEEGGHGLFTRRLLEGLRGLADTEGRGIITAAQLASWIEQRVVRDSKGRMTPQYGKLDGEGQFVFVTPRASGDRAYERAPAISDIAQQEQNYRFALDVLQALRRILNSRDGLVSEAGDKPWQELKRIYRRKEHLNAARGLVSSWTRVEREEIRGTATVVLNAIDDLTLSWDLYEKIQRGTSSDPNADLAMLSAKFESGLEKIFPGALTVMSVISSERPGKDREEPIRFDISESQKAAIVRYVETLFGKEIKDHEAHKSQGHTLANEAWVAVAVRNLLMKGKVTSD